MSQPVAAEAKAAALSAFDLLAKAIAAVCLARAGHGDFECVGSWINSRGADTYQACFLGVSRAIYVISTALAFLVCDFRGGGHQVLAQIVCEKASWNAFAFGHSGGAGAQQASANIACERTALPSSQVGIQMLCVCTGSSK